MFLSCKAVFLNLKLLMILIVGSPLCVDEVKDKAHNAGAVTWTSHSWHLLCVPICLSLGAAVARGWAQLLAAGLSRGAPSFLFVCFYFLNRRVVYELFKVIEFFRNLMKSMRSHGEKCKYAYQTFWL